MSARRPDVDKEWLMMEEVAAWLDVGYETVRRWISDKRLPAFKSGTVVRVHIQALEEFVLDGSTV